MKLRSENSRKERKPSRLPEWKRVLRKFTIGEKRIYLTIAIALVCILAGNTAGLLTSRESVRSHGVISTLDVGLFWDKACANNVTSISWGTISPGTSVSRIMWVRNEGTSVGRLSMTYGNWTPISAASFFTFAWNCTSYSLVRNGIVCAKLTLSLEPNVTGVGDFDFMIFVQITG